MTSMNVSEVKLQFINPQNGLFAFASIVVGDMLFLGSIGVHRKLHGGYRLTYPTRKVGEVTVSLYHPLSPALSKAVEEAIFSKVKDVYEKGSSHVGHDRPHAPGV